MKLLVYSPRPSKGARVLAKALKARKVGEKKLYERDADKLVVVNWGSSHLPGWKHGRLLNHPDSVRGAIHKTRCLETLKKAEIPHLDFTTNPKVAKTWAGEGRVIARTLLTSHSGNGIVVVEQGGEVPNAPLYTRYYPKTHEFRVHVVRDKVVDFVQKKARTGSEPNRTVRTHNNGWVYAHEDIVLSAADRIAIDDACVNTVSALGLDFGAVDVLVRLRKGSNRKMLDFKIAEVNTAPGLENTQTIDAYSNSLKELVNV